MRRIRSCNYPDLLNIFTTENAEKDSRNNGRIDDWPRHRFQEANAEFSGEWYEYEFDQADLSRIRIHWNKEFETPLTGMMLRDALSLPKFKAWVSDGKAARLPLGTHLWLASRWFNNGGVDYKDMTDTDGCFMLLDGVHRSLAWAHLGIQSVLAFVAGNPELTRKR
jgi:hypothetical protein